MPSWVLGKNGHSVPELAARAPEHGTVMFSDTKHIMAFQPQRPHKKRFATRNHVMEIAVSANGRDGLIVQRYVHWDTNFGHAKLLHHLLAMACAHRMILMIGEKQNLAIQVLATRLTDAPQSLTSFLSLMPLALLDPRDGSM